MRVLRIRRGFTTNSSGANEFLPQPGSCEDAGASADASCASGTGQPLPPPPPTWEPSNGLVLALVGVGLVLVFTADRAVRAVLRRREGSADAATAAPEE